MDILIAIFFWGLILLALIGVPIFFIYDQKRLNKKIAENRKKRKELEIEGKPNMIHCPDCGKEISKNADKCPECGRIMQENNNNTSLGSRIIIGIILLIIGIFLFNLGMGFEVKPILKVEGEVRIY